MLFLSARLAVVHLGKIAFHGLQLPDTLFICPVLVVKGVLLGGKLLDFSLQRFIGGQLGNAFLPKISYGCVCYDKVTFVLLSVGCFCFGVFLLFQPIPDRAFRVPPFGNWWMGWRFTTSFWTEKKQETFFRFPARCAAVWAVGI